MVKIIGSILVILATALIGFDLSARLEKRKKALADFHEALVILRGEISFAANPLPTAFLHIAQQMPSLVGQFFRDVGETTQENSFAIQKSWCGLLEEYKKPLYLTEQDTEVLTSFAGMLGKTNQDNQVKHIQNTLVKLEMQLTQAQESCGKNRRVYQSVGVLSGMLLAILLI